MARLLLLDNINGTGFSEVECNGLDDYYKYLQCDCIDIPRRWVNGVLYSIYIDDEGLLKSKEPVLSLVTVDNPYGNLYGNLIFSVTDEEGNTCSLTDRQISEIRSAAMHRADDKIVVLSTVRK